MAKRSAPLRRAYRQTSADKRVQLTWTELRKLRREVLSHFKARGMPNVVDIGIGRKNPLRKRSGKTSLIFVVSKRLPEAKLATQHRLGRHRRYKVRIGSGKRARWVEMGGDVVSAKAIQAVPVAGQIAVGAEQGTAGIILRWTEDSVRRWGVLTVGHVTLGGDGDPPILQSASGQDIGSVRLRLAPPNNNVTYDAAVFSVDRADVNLLNNTVDPDLAGALLPGDGIIFDGDVVAGTCHTRLSGEISVNIKAAFVSAIQIAGWKNVQPVFAFTAIGSAVRPFAVGNSGSAVTDAAGGALGFLVATDESTNAIGYAQPLDEVLAYIATQMGVTDLAAIAFC